MTSQEAKKELLKFIILLKEFLEDSSEVFETDDEESCEDPLADFDTDNYGQIVIYTSIFRQKDGSYRTDD